jgi:hydroxymethylpyrimidine pyrophosphatase-like HAD family hydrolase
MPLLAVGSGGSFTTAHLACGLHQRHFRLPAAPVTPLELASTDIDLREAAVLLLTAGGKNPDILAAADEAVGRDARRLAVICASTGTELARRMARFSTVEVCDFDLPSGGDGFLATNSLLASGVLLVRAYAEAGAIPHGLPATLEELTGSRGVDFSHVVARDTLVVLHSPSLKPAAVEIESKFAEAALGNVQIADYRQFAHGRHHWLAKRGDTSAVIALGTEADASIVEATMSLLPDRIPQVRLTLPFEGQTACLAGIVDAFDLVRQAGEARSIDPGDPGVPAFGRKLYNLRAISPPAILRAGQIAEAAVAVERKTRVAARAMSGGYGEEWERAYVRFLDRLRGARIRGIVADYDGTLCDEARRFDSLPTPVAAELTRLLRAGIAVGVATGRGKSVRERLQEAIPEDLWERVVVGYYNGGDIGFLGDGDRPDGSPAVGESLQRAADVLKEQQRFLGVAQVEHRRRQITLKSSGSLDRLWHCVQGLLGPDKFPGIAVLRSGHSIDIIAPWVSKLAVVERVVELCGGGDDEILCIGDQGCWPGNDYQLLGTSLSLSANVTSADPERCWNLAPPGVRESQATLGYLRRLKPALGGLRFTMPGR